jgi:hypothetical protein
MLSLPGRHTSTRWERRQLKDWACLAPSLTREANLSFRNGVLLYKQLIRPIMDYACPIWRSAVRSHVRKLQVLQSKCLHIATDAPWYVSDRQIHEDLGIPFFADHIKALTEGTARLKSERATCDSLARLGSERATCDSLARLASYNIAFRLRLCCCSCACVEPVPRPRVERHRSENRTGITAKRCRLRAQQHRSRARVSMATYLTKHMSYLFLSLAFQSGRTLRVSTQRKLMRGTP